MPNVEFTPIDRETMRAQIVIDGDVAFLSAVVGLMAEDNMVVAPILGLGDENAAVYVSGADAAYVILACGAPETLNGPAGQGASLRDVYGREWSILGPPIETPEGVTTAVGSDLLAQQVGEVLTTKVPGWSPA